MLQKWEYKTEIIIMQSNLTALLNLFGEDGWELVTVVFRPISNDYIIDGNWRVVFKRPIPPASGHEHMISN